MRRYQRTARTSIAFGQLLGGLAFISAASAQAPGNHPVLVAPHPAMMVPQIHVPVAPVMVAPVHPAPVTSAAPAKSISPAARLNPQTPATATATGAAVSTSHVAPALQAKSASDAAPAGKQQGVRTDGATATDQISGPKKTDATPSPDKPASNSKPGTPGIAPPTAEQKEAHNKLEGAKEEMYEAKKSGDQKRIDRAQQDLDEAKADVQVADKDAAAPKTSAQAKALADLAAAKKDLDELNHQAMMGYKAVNKLDRAAAEARIAKALAEVDAADAGKPQTEAEAKTQADIAEAQKLLGAANEKKDPADASVLDHDVERNKADRTQLLKDQNAVAQDNQALAHGDRRAADQLAEDRQKEAADAAKVKTDAAAIINDKVMDIDTRILKDKEKLAKDTDAIDAAKGDPLKLQVAQDKANADRRAVDRDEKKQKDIKDREGDIESDITSLKGSTDLGNDQGIASAEGRLQTDEKQLDNLLGIPDPDSSKGKK